MKYKWDSPHDWLTDRMDNNTLSAREIVNALLDKVDADTLQDIFQSEMDEDGYFTPQDESGEDHEA